MLRTSESETEILLGNKQLLGIFFVVAVLLGVAFASGYMVGRGPGVKKPIADSVTAPVAGGETHSVPGEASSDSTDIASAPRLEDSSSSVPKRAKAVTAPQTADEAPLGSPKRKAHQTAPEVPVDVAPLPASSPSGSFVPKEGQMFLQVAAVGRDEADAVADVLHKKGFRAHAVAKPGNAKLYRVLIGPIRDPSDLSSTRDSLRKTGFREVIVQHY